MEKDLSKFFPRTPKALNNSWPMKESGLRVNPTVMESISTKKITNISVTF